MHEEHEICSAIKNLCEYCLEIKRGESVLIIADSLTREVAVLLEEGASQYTNQVMTMFIPVTPRDGAEPHIAVANAMSAVDVVLASTSKSITHTRARRQASQKGVRIASMPGITVDMFVRGLNADYDAIRKRTEKLKDALKSGRRVRVTSDKGTDIIFSINKYLPIAETGLLREAGSFGNLPAGEVYIAPDEESAEGIIVFEQTMAGIGLLREPIKVFISAGKAVQIEGGEEAELLKQILSDVCDEGAYLLAEFGIGTNESVRITGKFLEDEKVLRTVHFAFGNNASMGGHNKVPIHLDGLVINPDVTVDGKLIMKKGELI